MLTDHGKALEMAREWLETWGHENCELRPALTDLLLRVQREARIGALEWTVKPIEVGIVTGHPRYRTIRHIEDEIARLRAEGEGDGTRA